MPKNEWRLNPGIEYQFEIIAYAAACLSQNMLVCEEVEDFEIYTNKDDVPSFDDIIIKVKYKSQKEPFIYMGQIKRYKKYIINFNKGTDKVGNYLENIMEIKNRSNRKPFLKRLLEDVPDENIKFFYFSNSFLSPTKDGSKNKLENPITLDDGTHCYLECDTSYKSIFPLQNSLTCYKLTAKGVHRYINIFNKFQFFLNQPDHKQIASRIVDLNPNIISISAANDIINYVDAYLKRYEKLTKHIFETHLLRLCLSPFVVSPTEAFKINPDLAHIWNELVMQFNITIISTDMISYIFGCIWQEIIKLYKSEFNWNECITDTKNINKEIDIDSKFVNLSKAKGSRHWLYIPDTITELLIEMWKSDYLPLVLSSNTNASILNKFRHLNKCFVILDIKDKIYNKISNLDLRVFANAANICKIDVGKEFLKNVFISLQGREPVDVYSILKEDTDLKKEIKCDHLLYFIREWKSYLKTQLYSNITKRMDNDDNDDNSVRSVQVIQNEKLEFTEGEKQFGLDADARNLYLDNYRAVTIIGRCLKKEEKYIKRFLRKATLEETIFNSTMKVICFVTGDLNDVDWMARNRNQIIQGSVDYVASKIKTELEQGKNAIAAIKDDDVEELWPKFSVKEYPLVYVKVENNLLSILKYQSLSSHISYSGSIFNEESFFEETSTGITLITGEPGSGKSSLLRYLFNICGKDNYVLFCDLNNYRQSLLEQKAEIFKNPLSFILGKEAKQSTYANRHLMCPSYLDFLQKFLVHRRELILFLDSFDEVLPVCQEPVLDFVRVLNKPNVRLIIACRLVMAYILINSFEVASTKIETLNTKDIKEYIANQKLSDDEFQKYPREFQENPMYLNFLVELHQDSSLLPDTITRCTLHNAIIKRHIERYYSKKTEAYSSAQYKYLRKDILGVHKSLALFEVFGDEVCKVTGLVYKDLMEECMATEKVKLGLIVRFNDDGPVFLHRTFAEYLIAEWLTENVGQKYFKDIYEKLFSKGMVHIRLFLDDILCENLRLHKAVLAVDLPLVQSLCSEDDNHLKKVDQLNRNALHLAATYFSSIGWSFKYNNQSIIFETIVRHMKISGLDFSNNYDLIRKLTWLQYLEPEFERMYNITVINLPVTSEIYFICAERIEDGIVWSMDRLMLNTAIELLKRKECLLSKYYDKLLLAAVPKTQFKELLQLVELKNYKNMKFEILWKACKDLSAASTVSKCTDLQICGGFTALHVACIYGSTDVVKELLKLGVEVDATDDFECEPLYYSVIQGSVEIVTCLVEHISSVNKLKAKNYFASKLYKEIPFSKDFIHEPYLHISLRNNYIEIAKVLLEHGFDINERNSMGDTALHLALEYINRYIRKNATTIKLLLNYSPNCNIQNYSGETPLHKAINNVFANIMPIFQSIESDIKNGFEIIELLLKSGADTNIEDKDGDAPLQIALKKIVTIPKFSRCGQYNINHFSNVLKILLEAGAVVNHKARDGNTALHIAAKTFKPNFVQILIDSGGDVDLEDRHGDTALTIAAEFNDLNTRILLNAGADVNHRNKFGDTALHVAAKFDQLDIAKTLLENGADVDIENEEGDTALFTATTRNPDVRSPFSFLYNLLAYLIDNKFRVGTLLLEKGANINHQNKLGETALHLAAREGRINILKILLCNNADKNSVNKEGYTPIYVAIRYNNGAVVDILSK